MALLIGVRRRSNGYLGVADVQHTGVQQGGQQRVRLLSVAAGQHSGVERLRAVSC